MSRASDLSPEERPDDATRTGSLAAAGLKSGAVLASRFRIDRLLGIGGMGMVYAATDLDLDIPVAIKLLRPELALKGAAFERIRQELLIARQVSSPHVVRIHDLARDGDRAFITMDLVDGEPLDRLLERQGMLPVDQAVELAIQVAEGLQAAHTGGVVHRDLKPSNVLLDQRGRALIADFGVARSLATGSVRSHSGAIVGTPEYLSPEQARGLPVDGRSDLYTLGLLLFEMLTGRLPFDAATPAEAMSQRLLAVPRPLRQFRPEAPAWLEQLLARLLRTSPAHRLPDAQTVIAVLRTRQLPRDAAQWRRRGLWTIAALLLVLLALQLTEWRLWRQEPQPVTTREPFNAIPAPAARLLVVADAGSNLAARDRLEGIAAVLRRLLDGQARWPVIDVERGQQAVAQLSLLDGPVPGAETLWSQLPGARILRLLALAEGKVRLELQGPGARVLVESADGAALLAATRAALVDGSASTQADSWPADLDDRTLAALGQAVRQHGMGELRSAADVLDTVLANPAATGPGHALLALERAQLALRTGDGARARELLEANAPALPRALAPALADLRAQLGADADGSALALLQQRRRERPADPWLGLALARAQGEAGELGAALAALEQLCLLDPGEPRAWFLRGKYSILRGEARVAVDDYLVRALVLYKRARNPYGEAEAVNALGVAYARLGQNADAAEQYERAVTLRRALGNRRGEASSLRNLAQLATVRGEAERAAGLLEQARVLFEELGDGAGQAAIDNELGLLAEERGDYTQALAAYRRGLRARERLDDPQASAESLNNLGFAHYQLGDYDSAQVYWRQAADVYQQIDDLSGQVRTAQNLGLLETARGAFAAARAQLEGSLKLAEQQQMAEETAVSHRNLAELALHEGRLRAAQVHLERARALFADREDQRGLVDAALLAVQLKMAAGLNAQAAAALAGLAPTLPEGASLEQRAQAALLGAELGEGAAVATQLTQARLLANQSGVRVLALDVRLQAPDAAADATLGAEIEALGHVPLWLRWLELRMDAALSGTEPAAATATYATVVRLLSGSGGQLRAWQLHGLGARILQAAGRDAAPAQAAARQAARLLLDDLPDEVDAGWRQQLQAVAGG